MVLNLHYSVQCKFQLAGILIKSCILIILLTSILHSILRMIIGLMQSVDMYQVIIHFLVSVLLCTLIDQCIYTFSLQIAENVAKQYGMSKSEFLDPNAADLAVRMALGETHIIAETKRALSDEGVNIEVLEDIAAGKTIKVNRSSSVILVKNLPFSTIEADLVSMFGIFGGLARVILPPTKTLALVSG